MLRLARWCCGLRQAREKDTPNQALHLARPAVVVSERSQLTGAGRASELVFIDLQVVKFRSALSPASNDLRSEQPSCRNLTT
jgi:hypothetical protein